MRQREKISGVTVKGNTLDPCCDETLLYLDCGDDDKVHM